MTTYLSLLVAIVGLIIYFVTQSNTKLTEVGRILFFCGTLAWLITTAGGKTLHF